MGAQVLNDVGANLFRGQNNPRAHTSTIVRQQNPHESKTTHA